MMSIIETNVPLVGCADLMHGPSARRRIDVPGYNSSYWTGNNFSYLSNGIQLTTSGAKAKTINAVIPPGEKEIFFQWINQRGAENDTTNISPFFDGDNIDMISFWVISYTSSANRVEIAIGPDPNNCSILTTNTKYNYYNLYNTIFNLRMYKFGSIVKVKIWHSTEQEPTTWDHNLTVGVSKTSDSGRWLAYGKYCNLGFHLLNPTVYLCGG